MKIKFKIKRQVKLSPDSLEEKVNKYLMKNSYRIVEKGLGFIIFVDDEYSDRKRFKSDYHTRIGEGKFEFHSTGNETQIKLTYLTRVFYPIFLMVLFATFGMYKESLVPIFFSLAFSLPILYKIYYLNEHVFNEVLEC